MISDYIKFIGKKDNSKLWRKAKQREYTGEGSIEKIKADLTTNFSKLTTRNSITLRYLGFIINKGSDNLEITSAGIRFLGAVDKQKVVDEQLLKVYLDCTEISNKISIKVVPMQAILEILLETKYITFEEYGLFVCWINNKREVRTVIDFIKNYRKYNSNQIKYQSELKNKVRSLNIDDFGDNIKRFFDMLCMASFFDKRYSNGFKLKITNKSAKEILSTVDVGNFTKRRYYYTFLTTGGQGLASTQYKKFIKEIKSKTIEEKTELVNTILSPTYLPLIEDVVPKEIHFTIKQQAIPKKRTGVKKPKKIDYVEREAVNRIHGDQAEKVVVKYEREQLIKNKKNKLATRVEQLSLTDDTLGYDVLSFDVAGKEKHIEVKGVKGKPSKVFRFYISQNEIAVARKDKFYFIYIVFNCISRKPLIYKMSNPFKNSIKGVDILPIKYAVEVQIKI